MENEKLKIVIVGHVDHGKSTLIGRLLYDTQSITKDRISEVQKISDQLGQKFNFAYLLDHLQEEREQGITIDTTQTYFRTSKKQYVIIDAPGHVEFIKNMITGASQAEAAILIVDAEEGCREQTKRHAFILSMLGIKELIVVINKMDLMEYRKEVFYDLKTEIEEFFDSINLKPSCFIPISALEGDNIVLNSSHMSWYAGKTLLEYLDDFEKPHNEAGELAILPIQDVYKFTDKRIAVGKLEAGKLRVDEEIIILPSNARTQIKTIEKYLEDVTESEAGECTGITTKDPVFLERGNIVCSNAKTIAISNTFKASIFWMSPEKLRVGEKAKIQCATQETLMEIIEIHNKINSSSLENIDNDFSAINPLEACQVLIRTKKPFIMGKFNDLYTLGRIVILKDNTICAGGIITEIENNKN